MSTAVDCTWLRRNYILFFSNFMYILYAYYIAGVSSLGVPPDFGRLVNPISTRGDRLYPPHYYWHPRISDLPTALHSMYCFVILILGNQCWNGPKEVRSQIPNNVQRWKRWWQHVQLCSSELISLTTVLKLVNSL